MFNGAEKYEVYWYETFNKQVQDIPSYVEANIIQQHFDLNGALPRWNKQF